MMNEGTQSSATEQSSAPVANEQASQPSQSVSEKLLPQTDVNRIASDRYNAGYEKAKKEFASQQPASAPLDTEQFTKMYAQVREQERQAEAQARDQYAIQQAQKAVEDLRDELVPKLKTDGESKYEDYSSVTAKLPLHNPGLLWALKSVDNPSDLAYEFAKDPVRKKVVMDLLNSQDTSEFEDGIAMLKQLAGSIKNNHAVASRGLPKQPLSTVKPSGTGADNGMKSVADLMKVYTA